ncbi:unnamed protein product, partial [Adineta ricciae]
MDHGNRDSQQANNQTLASWLPVLAIFFILIVLGIIAGVVVLSLLSLYLPNKADNMVINHNNNVIRTIDMALATSLDVNNIFNVGNYDSIGKQLEQYLGYSSSVLNVQWAAFSSNTLTASTSKKKKREISDVPSCTNGLAGTNNSEKKSANLGLTIRINKCPQSQCNSDHCVEKCLHVIKVDIQNKLGSNPFSFSITAVDGNVHSISSQLCSFQQPVAAPATCFDGIQNQDETDIDCGGLICPLRCPTSKKCQKISDCTKVACTCGICQVPTCSDGIRNQDESGIDCGGKICQNKCATNVNCTMSSDCESSVCTNKKCQAPLCNDFILNGDETGIDCGGALCSKCSAGQNCKATSDCGSGLCVDGTCKNNIPDSTCCDGIKNGMETDVDCGGSTCKQCADNMHCLTKTDCSSKKCTNNICQVPTCSDGIVNRDETGKDCGGNFCAACPEAAPCTLTADCNNVLCTNSVCQ